MTPFVSAGFVVTWIALAWGAMFVYQLLRQNGRLLARVDALETERQRSGPERRPPSFGDRSLAASRINRNGLKPGMQAPAFRLPRVDGGMLALEEYRGRRLLLVFSSPECQPCAVLAPQLQRAWASSDLDIVMVSRGDVDINRRKVAQYGVTFPVVLQRHWEVSVAYAKFVTPMAYLIDERGMIASDVAVGAQPILDLLSASGSVASADLVARDAAGTYH